MTDNYRSELFSRIKKLNFSNMQIVGQAFHLFLIFFAFFVLFFGAGYIIRPDESTKNVVTDFFCTGFADKNFFSFLRQAVSFASADFYSALLILISGYTMLSFPISTLCLIFTAAKSGYCFSCLWQILIDPGRLSGGGATFAYFAICKACVLAALIFVTICARDFSYRYSDLYRRSSRPLTSPESANYATVALSGAGFTALINLLFLTFQYISPSTYI